MGRDHRDFRTADMADHRPVEARPSGSVDVEEIDLIKIVLSTSLGTPVVIAVPPGLVVNEILEVIAFMAANERGFRAAYVAALQSRQEPVLEPARGRLKEV